MVGGAESHASTVALNPPYAIFFISNGIGLSFHASGDMAGSFMTFAFTWSLCFRDLKTIKENTTVSLGFIFVIRGKVNAVPIPLGLRSYPMHSKYSRAPCFFHVFPP